MYCRADCKAAIAGFIRSLTVRTPHALYELEDFTGTITVSLWIMGIEHIPLRSRLSLCLCGFVCAYVSTIQYVSGCSVFVHRGIFCKAAVH